MNHGSLFSGIGGFELAAEWMGWENIFSCEINPFGRKVLNYYWPKTKHYEDINKTDFSIYRGRIDILTGGFPCQPFSLAGKRKGTEDDRHLWPEMLRVIRETTPKWVVGENVYGLVNWDGGLVFEQVQVDLEAEGYEVLPIILPAAGVNAPHRRDRIWFVAYAEGINGGKRNGIIKSVKRDAQTQFRRLDWSQTFNPRCDSDKIKHFTNSRDDGLSSRLDGITFSKWRNESIKAYGNAIVPQVVYQIFKIIEQMK